MNIINGHKDDSKNLSINNLLLNRDAPYAINDSYNYLLKGGIWKSG